MKLTQANPYDHSEILSNQYRVQNMLIRAVNMPGFVPEGAEVFSVYEDRVEWETMQAAREEANNGNPVFLSSWPRQANDTDLLTFCSVMLGHELRGCRVVRYTNVATGFPCCRIDGWWMEE